VGFDSVLFADSASAATLSCFSRLKAERDAGRKTILIPLFDLHGADIIAERGLATVKPMDPSDPAASPATPWRERFSVIIRRLGVAHVMAPLGLLAAPQAIDYFGTLRAALSVDKGRDLLLFEERPACLAPESVLLRLAAMGARLPPASHFRSPRRYWSFALRVASGLGVPPIYGAFRDRFRLARSLKASFREAADWDPQRALGPKLQPVIEPWRDEDSTELFDLAAALGLDHPLGSLKTFRRRMLRHAAGAGSRTPVERYWLSLPGSQDLDPLGD
jgi:hypothetical protein